MHTLDIRIYYEDTDSLGLVYYANYLKFLERARTEFFRDQGLDLGNIIQDCGLFFVVRSCNIKFISPASFDDLLQIISNVKKIKKNFVQLEQNIILNKKTILKGEINLACVNSMGNSDELPKNVYNKLLNFVG